MRLDKIVDESYTISCPATKEVVYDYCLPSSDGYFTTIVDCIKKCNFLPDQFIIPISPTHITDDLNNDLTIHPNPTNSNLTIELNYTAQNINIEIYDLHANKLYSTNCTNTNTHTINADIIKKLGNGTFTLRLDADNRIITSKFVINK